MCHISSPYRSRFTTKPSKNRTGQLNFECLWYPSNKRLKHFLITALGSRHMPFDALRRLVIITMTRPTLSPGLQRRLICDLNSRSQRPAVFAALMFTFDSITVKGDIRCVGGKVASAIRIAYMIKKKKKKFGTLRPVQKWLKSYT